MEKLAKFKKYYSVRLAQDPLKPFEENKKLRQRTLHCYNSKGIQKGMLWYPN